MNEGNKTRKGRGALNNPDGRYNATRHSAADDGWPQGLDETGLATRVEQENARTILSQNQSPDIPFTQSINPYRGCEHGCVYCYARPTHAYVGLSPGLDFETRLTAKTNAATLLRTAFRARDYRCSPIALGANTDPYQPVERTYGITREMLEVLLEYRHPCVITTKSALIERDLDLLAAMAALNLVQVNISLTTLNATLARTLEPRASAPHRRLKCIETLRSAGIPVAVLLAPVIPVLTDPEMERVLSRVASAGAQFADYILLRLPLEVAPLFSDWLNEHFPGQAGHVLNQIRACRAGNVNDPHFGSRMRGEGVYADMLSQRFRLATRKLGLAANIPALDCSRFSRQHRQETPVQMDLFE